MDRERWESLRSGKNCPLDAPRPDSNDEWDLVAKLSVSALYLAKNQTYRGQCILIFDLRHAAAPDQLSPKEWASFCADLHGAEVAIMQIVKADHVNLESLGNVVPHLHWHIIPRYWNDPRWGAPVWMTSLSDMPVTHLEAPDRMALIEALREALINSAR